MGKNSTNENMTNSQAKRAARKAAANKLKKQHRMEAFAGYVFYAIIAAFIGIIVGAIIVNQMNKVTAKNDYSACLDANGYISGVTASSVVNLPHYKNATVALSEVEFTDDKVEEDIQSQLESHKTLNDDPELKVADGDEVNIDYVGTVDGEEFDGGSAQGYDLVIGSGSFIEGFEEQLIGAQVQSNFDINVTFPEDYSTEDLQGKAAVFNVTINGINETPEFTDEFVAENLSDKASTVEEYKQYLKDTNYDTNLTTWVENYLKDNSTASDFNRKYLSNLKSVEKYEAEQGYASMDDLYQMYFGTSYTGTFEDYVGMTEKEYDKSLVDTAKETYKNNLVYQAIVELEGATADAAYYKEYLTQSGQEVTEYDTLVETYGEPYVLQMAIKQKAIELVKGMVTVQ